MDFWNSNLVFAGQGACSAKFTFGSGFEDISKFDISVNLEDRAEKNVGKDEIHLDSFGQPNATRYAQAFVEGEEICDSSLKLVVTRAIAAIEGR
ncbi:IrmA family protein [Comamonas testosteroni]|uniref:IrmA family protein n=1 Tax=Comamonas testosteroni TaxID=285 RepID=UPI00350E4E16